MQLALGGQQLGLILLAGCAAGVYVASRSAVDALAGPRHTADGTPEPPSPGRRAIGHFLPVAAMALLALFYGYPDVTVGVIFATSVASLALVAGLVLLLSHAAEQSPTPLRRTWAFILPVAALALLAGFSGQLTPFHAEVLLMEGLVIFLLWLGRPKSEAPPSATAAVVTDPPPRLHPRKLLIRAVELILALALAVLAAWAGTRGVIHVSQTSRMVSPALLAVSTLSPLLTLPMISGGLNLGGRGHASAALTSAVGVTLLNLCLLLPLVIGLWYGLPEIAPRLAPWVQIADAAPSTQPATTAATRASPPSPPEVKPLPFPLAAWRIDTVVLAALGLLLIPAAVGRWELGRGEGLGLVIGYAIYLAASTILGLRWG